MISWKRIIVGTAAAVVCTPIYGPAASAQSAPPAHVGGIWKAVVPPSLMNGEFDNFDPIGVAAGARIKADCSINWVNPDDGSRYCFSSGTSLEFFLDSPNTSIARARAGWNKLNGQKN